VLIRGDHHTMLRSAGFAMVEETDVTPDYLTTIRAWFTEASARAEELRAVQGDRVFQDGQRERQLHAAAVESGLLRRSLLVAYGQSIRRPRT
jgi:cyclopropane fatty-acyl-phospholipid synthase-like methyltransferase